MIFVTVALAALAGLVGGNALPHFVRGITKQKYPSVFGSSPVINLLVGWVGLVLAALIFIVGVDVSHYPVATFVSVALGVLCIGLFHASVGAFGKRP